MSDSMISIILKCELNTSISAAWLIILETCRKDDSCIDLHDTDIDFLRIYASQDDYDSTSVGYSDSLRNVKLV